MTRFFPEKESNIKDDVRRYLDDIGAWWFMPVNANRRGIPDFIVCYRGFFLAVEAKKKKESRISGIQRFELERIRKNRGIAVVCSDVSQLREYIEYISKLANSLYGSTVHVARPDEKLIDLRKEGQRHPGGAGGTPAS